MSRLPAMERMLLRIAKSGSCWLWTGQANNKGYGLFHYEGQKRAAHRVAYMLFVGPIPVGLELDHLCRVPLCVNPAHLEPVTHAENQKRMGAARTHCVHGHLYTPDTTYRDPNGRRRCRACARVRDRQPERQNRKGVTA